MNRPAFEKFRNLINSVKGRFCGVQFTKKDVSERTMCIQPAKLKFHLKGDNASEAAQRAVETRKANYPHLMPVWDTAKAAPRSVNLLTVTRIRVDGHTHNFAT